MNDKRMIWCISLAALALISNILQLILGFIRHGQTEQTIRNAAGILPWPDYYSGLFFADNCLAQSKIIYSGSGKVVGIFPMFFAEIFVLLVAIAFVFTVAIVSRQFQVSRFGIICAILVSISLFLVDQVRYYFTSVADLSKTFFTWSSYCVHGDWGWLFDAIGYLFMYALITIAIAYFIAAISKLRDAELDIEMPWLGQPDAFKAVEATFSWLVYFGYLFLVIWVVFSGLNPEASKLYAVQVLIIYAVIFAFYFMTIYRYSRIAIWYDKESRLYDNPCSSPIAELLAPHGTRAFQILIKLSLPVIFILSIWFEVFKELLGILSG